MVDGRSGWRHPSLSSHALAGLRKGRRPLPLHADVQSLWRGSGSPFWRRSGRLARCETRASLWPMDAGRHCRYAAGLTRNFGSKGSKGFQRYQRQRSAAVPKVPGSIAEILNARRVLMAISDHQDSTACVITPEFHESHRATALLDVLAWPDGKTSTKSPRGSTHMT
jgi:hypothetical protein